jgi:competence protein ComEC
MDPLLLVAAALLAGSAVPSAPFATTACVLGVLVTVRRHGVSMRTIVLASLVFVMAGARATMATDAARAFHAETVHALTPPRRCIAEATVASSPVALEQNGAAADESGRLDADLEEPECDGASTPPFRVRLYGAPLTLARGDRVSVVADVAPVHLFLNEGSSSPWPAIARTGVASSGGAIDMRVLAKSASPRAWIDRARQAVRSRIDATFHPEAAPLARALVLGETNLDPADAEAFRASGLAHLLAVSGTHLAIAVLSLVRAARAILLRSALAARMDVGRPVSLAAIPITWIYADFAGGSGSAVRAAAMLTTLFAARAVGVRPSGPRAFTLTLIGACAVDPLLVGDVSFLLSAAATAGLLLSGPTLRTWLHRAPNIARPVLGAAATALSATLPCAPLLAALSPTLPLLGVVANVVAAPIGELAALPICLAHAALAWTPRAEAGAAAVGGGALLAVRSIARVTAAAPGSLAIPPPTAWQLAALAVTATGFALARRPRERGAWAAFGVVATAALEIVARREGRPEGVLRITMLDVGQGDSLLIDLPDGSALLVDGGGFVGSPVDPGLRVIVPLLRARRRSRLDRVVLSHPHPDHFGGLASIMAEVEVGEFWDSGQGEAQGAGTTYASMLGRLRERGVPVVRPNELCGHTLRAGGATVAVIAPCPGFDPNLGANDNSLVLRVSFGNKTALLVGDAEHAEEARLTSLGDLHADVLKVGHHGSRTSTSPGFLAAVAPRFALISSGVRNRFGHPHPSTLDTLARSGIPALQTCRGGSIEWRTDGRSDAIVRPLEETFLARLLRPGE